VQRKEGKVVHRPTFEVEFGIHIKEYDRRRPFNTNKKAKIFTYETLINTLMYNMNEKDKLIM